MEKVIKILKVGRMGYLQCLQLQNLISNKVRIKEIEDTLIIVEHNPVYTVGLRDKLYSKDEELKLKQLGAEFYRTNRGGLITFHGLGQMVVYPIINLKNYQPSVRWYVSELEKTVIELCKCLGIKAETSVHTGVWVNDAKICALGIHASRYITSHGLALNCNTDLSWFDHIVPCGIEGKTVTSLTQELKRVVDIEETIPLFLKCFEKRFNCKTCMLHLNETENYLHMSTGDDFKSSATIQDS